MNNFIRNISLFGEQNFERIKSKTVLVAGLGGVGGAVVECLARLGFSSLILIDNDKVDVSNINRQLIANNDTIGVNKVDCWKERILKINPQANVVSLNMFIDSTNINTLYELKFDYLVDAIDTSQSKLLLYKLGIDKQASIISSMGTANKLDPSLVYKTTLNKTERDKLAKKMRMLCKEANIDTKSIIVVTSKEEPLTNLTNPLPSCINVPLAAGNLISNIILKDIFKKENIHGEEN